MSPGIDEVLALVRRNVLDLKPYSSARDEFDNSSVDFTYLDANENPYPSGYNRYPDPHQRKLKARIAEVKGTSADKIFLGNGSDEAIDLIIRIFCEPAKDNILIPRPTYGMYQVAADVNDIAVRNCDLTPDFDLNASSIMSGINGKTKLIFLCSPNNPSGNLLSEGRVVEVLNSFPGVVVLDEAYIDFTGTPGFLQQLDRFANLIILQTFSKAWGLAGLRLGVAFSHPRITEILDKVKPPYNINTVTQEIALQYLSSSRKKDAWVDAIKTERARLSEELRKGSEMINVFPSDANFLLVRIPRAATVYHTLLKKGIVVRDRSSVRLCDDCLRITVGTPEENNRLIKAIRSL